MGSQQSIPCLGTTGAPSSIRAIRGTIAFLKKRNAQTSHVFENREMTDVHFLFHFFSVKCANYDNKIPIGKCTKRDMCTIGTCTVRYR